MDKRGIFWQRGYNKFSSIKEKEHEVNIYTRHGWSTRLKVFKNLLPELLKNKKKSENLSAVDLGCGTARYAGIMKSAGLETTACDFSFKILEFAKKTRKERLNYVNADCHKLPFRENSFDILISFGVISIMTDPGIFFKEINRVSKNDAEIMLMTLNKLYISNIRRFFVNFRDLPEDVGIIEYNPLKLKKRLRREFKAPTEFIPIFIFPKPFRFLEAFFQKNRLSRLAGIFLASAFILKISRNIQGA